jgi:hypothetical protein
MLEFASVDGTTAVAVEPTVFAVVGVAVDVVVVAASGDISWPIQETSAVVRPVIEPAVFDPCETTTAMIASPMSAAKTLSPVSITARILR